MKNNSQLNLAITGAPQNHNWVERQPALMTYQMPVNMYIGLVEVHIALSCSVDTDCTCCRLGALLRLDTAMMVVGKLGQLLYLDTQVVVVPLVVGKLDR